MAAMQTARPAKDNKFEVVTHPRVFVFRTDNEGEFVRAPTGHVTWLQLPCASAERAGCSRQRYANGGSEFCRNTSETS